MSKLQTRFIDDTYLEYYNTGKHDLAQIYLKSEADKVIAELERMDTEHTLQIAKMNGYISHLEEERRWRKFSEEKPKEKQWILVFVENPSKYGTYIELRRWDMGCKFDVENQELYKKWMPLPSAPKEGE